MRIKKFAFYIPILLLVTVGVPAQRAQGSIFKPVKSDLKEIGCDLCMRMVLEAIDLTVKMREMSQGPLKEEKVHDMLDKICDPEKHEGMWLTSLDFFTGGVADLDRAEPGEIVGDWQRTFRASISGGDHLLIREHSTPGHCEEECRTAALSCQNLIEEEIDMDKFPVVLWRGDTGNGALARTACLDWTTRCRKKRGPVPSSRKDYEFKPKTMAEFQVEQMMKAMEAAGYQGKLVPKQKAQEAVAQQKDLEERPWSNDL